MSLDSAIVGTVLGPLPVVCDARWLMAYAAGIRADNDVFLNTARPGGVVAHPLFPVCPEWQLLTEGESVASSGLSPAEVLRGVHVSHDVLLHRAVSQDDRLTLSAVVVAIRSTSAGAYRLVRFDAADADGSAVWTTWMGGLFRGVDVDGCDREISAAPIAPSVPDASGMVRHEQRIAIGALDAHVYSECARIWNPIHTDVAVARAAGLDAPILHGTATLARAVSAVLGYAEAAPGTVRRVAGRFGAVVSLDRDITVQVLADEPAAAGRVIQFAVRNHLGEPAVRDGLVVLA